MQTQHTSHNPAPQAPTPRFLPKEAIEACKSYRDAVLLCWESRGLRGMTQRTLAEKIDIKPSHMSGMLNPEAVDEHGKNRPDLPGRVIDDFERECGNLAVTQFLVRKKMLTLMEEVIAQQRGGL